MARGSADWTRAYILFDGTNYQTMYNAVPIVKLSELPALTKGNADIGTVNTKYYPTTPTASYHTGSLVSVGADDPTKTDTITLSNPFNIKKIVITSSTVNSANYYKIERYDSGDSLKQTLILKAYDQATATFNMAIPIECDADDYLKLTVTNNGGIATTIRWNVEVLWTGTIARGGVIETHAITGMEDPYGLGWDGTYFYYGNNIDNYVDKIDTATWTAANYFTVGGSGLSQPSGLVYKEGFFWISNNAAGATKVFKFTAAGSLVTSWNTPASNPFGLTHDGTYIWLVEYNEQKIYKLNPANGAVIDSITLSEGLARSLAHDGTNLWVSDITNDLIYEVDPLTGTVKDSFDAPDSAINAICYVDPYLWAQDITSKKMYKVQL